MHAPHPLHAFTKPRGLSVAGRLGRLPAHIAGLLPILIVLLCSCDARSLQPAPGGVMSTGIVVGEGVAPPRSVSAPSIGVLGVSDLLRAEDGWWLLDGRSARLHRVGPDFQSLWSIGGRGNAPGELRAPRALLPRADSIVVVETGEHPVLQTFDSDGRFVRKEIVVVPECANFRIANAVLEPDGSYLLGGTCLRRSGVLAMGPAVVRYAGGEGVVIRSELRAAGPGRMNPDAAWLVRSAGRNWAGRSYDNCFRLLAEEVPDGQAVPTSEPDPLCIEPWEVVPLSMDRIAEAMPDPSRAALLPSVLGGIEHLPLMDRVFAHRDGIVVRQISGLESRSLVLLGFDGTTRRLAEGLPERSWIVGDSIVVAWDGQEGTHMEVRPLPSG
jgi:hypothetical protein